MALHKSKRGLELPITGAPRQEIEAIQVKRVAHVADDFPVLKARMAVEEGNVVKRGQPLFEDRNNPGVLHTAPAAGTVVAINRGDRRMLQSIVIDLSEGELRSIQATINFPIRKPGEHG